MYKQLVLTGVLVVGLSTVGVTNVHAHQGSPPIIEHFAEDFTAIHPFLSNLCGFEVQVDVDERGTLRIWPDGRVHVTQQGTVVLSNPATGASLVSQFAGSLRGQRTETVNHDGTLTITFDNVNTGIPEWWRDGDGNTLVKDRGYIRVVGEVVIDLASGEVISFDQEVTVHGPHPIAEQGGLDPSLACQYLGA